MNCLYCIVGRLSSDTSHYFETTRKGNKAIIMGCQNLKGKGNHHDSDTEFSYLGLFDLIIFEYNQQVMADRMYKGLGIVRPFDNIFNNHSDLNYSNVMT